MNEEEKVSDQDIEQAFQSGLERSLKEEGHDAQELEIDAKPDSEVLGSEVSEAATALNPFDALGYTSDQLKEILGKANQFDELKRRFDERDQKIFGKFGEMNKSIQSLSSKNTSAKKLEKITADMLSNIADEFGDMAAEAFANDLNRLFYSEATHSEATPETSANSETTKPEPKAVADEPQTDTKTAFDEDGYKKKVSLEMLDKFSAGWRDKVSSPEFEEWKKTLDPVTQENINNSWDVAYIAEKLQAFDQWKNVKNTNKADDAVKKARRLERSEPLKSASAEQDASPKDINSAFQQGLKNALRRA